MSESLYDNKHYNTPGHAHELTFSCYRKLPYFKDEIACRVFLDCIRMAQVKFSFHVWAYVVMSNHVHALIWPFEHYYSIDRILQGIKGTMSHRYSRFLYRTNPDFYSRFFEKNNGSKVFRFWQRGGGFDRNLYNEKMIHNSIQYIESNPVRAKLVKQNSEYRWSSAWVVLRNKKWRPLVDRSFVPVKKG